MKPFTNFMIARHSPLPLSGMALAVLDGIEPSEYRESLETSLEIASRPSPDLRKQITIIQETLHPDIKPKFFGMLAIVVGMAKATSAEHDTRYLAEPRSGRRPPSWPHRLRKALKNVITIDAIDSFGNKMACTFSDLAEFGSESFAVTVSN
jgi:hypothetical protein